MRGITRVSLLLFIISIIAGSPNLNAWWSEEGVPVSTATNSQNRPRMTYDGEGGAIIAWYDNRGTDYDIYTQSVDITGTVRWTVNGVNICAASGDQYDPEVTADGAGGAIVVWEDLRSGNYDVYAQLVDASGSAQWTTDGVALCVASDKQENPRIASDGGGGAIVAWEDFRNGDFDIYVQRVDAYGTVVWTFNGVAVCSASGDQHIPQIIPDGSGGAIIVWEDYRGIDYDLYAQRVDAAGTPLWTADGVPVCSSTGHQFEPRIITDDGGGAIVTWYDLRAANFDIYAQRIDFSGTVQWTAGGVVICNATDDQYASEIARDGTGGAIITWEDNRLSDSDIYTQRVDDSGNVQWTANGLPVCTKSYDQDGPRIIPDGAEGAIITWNDFRTYEYDIYAQKIDASGSTLWEGDGTPVCLAAEDQKRVQTSTDGAGGALVTWFDKRDADDDIYCQQVGKDGKTGSFPPVIHSVEDVPGDEGGCVNLAWDATLFDYQRGEVTEYTVWRALDTPEARMILKSGAEAVSSPSDLAEGESGRIGKEPILRLGSLRGEPYYWMLVSTQAAYRLEHYSMIVETLFDSSEVCQDNHYFQVIAHTGDPALFWTSATDSGYSVDNLSPCTPLGLAGEQKYSPAGLELTWAPNTEQDLACYNIYRGMSESFQPGEGNFIDSACDTVLFDSGWTWSDAYYYKVAAVDIHGNESGYALLCPADITDSDSPEVPEKFYLDQNFPNPFNPYTTIRFGLENPSHVRIAVYDAAGRMVSVLLDETRDAGSHRVRWNGKDSNGKPAASGVYFYSIKAGKFSQRRKMVLLR